MRLKSTLTIVSIAVLAFGMVFATSATQIDKIFAAPVIGEQNHIDANGGQLSDVFGNFFNPSSSKTSPSTDIPSSSTNSDQPCKQDNNEKGTHFYCEGTHHHCKPGPDNPKCVKT